MPVDESCRISGRGAESQGAYIFELWQGWNGPTILEQLLDPHRLREGEWQMNVGEYGDGLRNRARLCRNIF